MSAVTAMETAVTDVLPSDSDDTVYINPYAKGIRFNAIFISLVEVNSQRDNRKVREKVAKTIANKPSSNVVIIVKLNTVCIRNNIDIQLVCGLLNHSNFLLWC